MDEQLAKKAAKIQLVIMDVDGVLTDGRTLCIGAEAQGVFFHVQDGTGVKYLQRCGIKTAIISGRHLEAVKARSQEIGIEYLKLGSLAKLDAYEDLLDQTGVGDEAVCYVGDDMPDIPPMRRSALAVAVSNARPEVRQVAHLVTNLPGGHGAIRELAELIIKSRGQWDYIMERYK